VSRFLDYWKLPEETFPDFPRGGSGEDPTCAPPAPARYRGSTIWVHPLEAGSPAPFVTDDGHAFLPDDAIANVQLERYIPRAGGEVRKTELLKRAYYFLKPMMPRSVQLSAQRANARSRLRSVQYPEWPRDDSLRLFLHAALASVMESRGLRRVPFLGFWPRGRHWAACFTHDVEMTEGLRAMEKMAGIEEENGIRSTWYIVPERYPVSEADFEPLRRRGHEIGLHGLTHDGQLFSSRAEFSRRVPLINRYLRDWQAVGFRSPVLYRDPDWMPDLDIRYDSSFMDTAVLEPQPGGVSTCLPFHLKGRVVELPITMPMDHHLINLLREDLVEGMLAKFRWVSERKGLANFLYHPDYNLEDVRLRQYREVVEKVVATPGGWVATAAEIADFWNRRRASRVSVSGGRASVQGPLEADGAIWHAVLGEEGTVEIEVEPLANP
jgi:peptidoglycan/xylan/chitin deacetylase (PgdA/CDA1 family)